MKHNYNLLWSAVILMLASSFSAGQSIRSIDPDPYMRYTNHNPNFIISDSLSFYQRKGQWRQIIDDFWGAGDPVAQKHQIFNTFANYIQNNYPCFIGLDIDWNALRTSYYAQINDSTSRGRFSALMSHLAFELQEFHIWAWDDTIAETPLNPGTPVYVMGYTENVNHFGASISALPDSSLLVVNVIPNHPLGLQPGDIILGYEGIPWKLLTFELFNSNIPKIGQFAATDKSRTNSLLINAGMNWHLFSIIDVLKYSSKDTVHLKTDTLLTLDISEPVYNNPQVQIPGIPFPDYNRLNLFGSVTYGKYPATNIGYVYLAKHWDAKVNQEFGEAIEALFDTDGLIIDIRYNVGGRYNLALGLNKLFNFDLLLFTNLYRCSPANLNSLCSFSDANFNWSCDFNTIYDKPIAILTGPNTISFGDIDAYTFRQHPMSSLFGKPDNGAFAGGFINTPDVAGWNLFCANATFGTYENPDDFLIRKEVPVDKDVWLETDDVANGEDTVVKSALNWIHNLSYAHDVVLDRTYVKPLKDTLQITAHVENPNGNPLDIRMFITGVDSLITDSLELFDDGAHGDSLAADNLWAGSYVPEILIEQNYKVSITTKDSQAGTSRKLPAVKRFTTIGPLKTVWPHYIEYSYDETSRTQYIFLIIQNQGINTTAKDLDVKISTADPRVEEIMKDTNHWRNLEPGEIDSSDVFSYYAFKYSEGFGPENTKNNPIVFDVTFYSDAYAYWTNTIEFVTVTAIAGNQSTDVPDKFALLQNYPNPFNNSTMIKYQLAKPGQVELSIYDILGQKVTMLIRKKQPAGNYSLEWDAAGFSSGVYFYRLETNTGFLQTKKLLLLK